MRRTHVIRISTMVFSAVLAVGAPARAQVSEARLKELIKQAADAASQPVGFGEPQAAEIVQGQGPAVRLTLDDAVRFALERNLDIRVQRLNPELQDIALASAQAFYSPSLTSTLNRSSSVGTPSSQLQLSSGGKGVTQPVNAALFGDASARLRRVEQALHAVIADRALAIAHSGKQPQLGAVGDPVAAQLG